MTTRRKPPAPLPPLDGPFVALDFETADHGADSACAIGLARVEAGKVVHREAVLIRPPRERVMFTQVHGITWPMVRNANPFKDVWGNLLPLLDGAKFLAAHNANFDRRILHACCAAAESSSPPRAPRLCSTNWNEVPCRRTGFQPVFAGDRLEACPTTRNHVTASRARSPAPACRPSTRQKGLRA